MYMGTRLNINGFFTIPVLQKKIENMEDFNKSIVDNIDVFMKENENSYYRKDFNDYGDDFGDNGGGI